MRSRSGTVRMIDAQHRVSKLREFAAIDYCSPGPGFGGLSSLGPGPGGPSGRQRVMLPLIQRRDRAGHEVARRHGRLVEHARHRQRLVRRHVGETGLRDLFDRGPGDVRDPCAANPVVLLWSWNSVLVRPGTQRGHVHTVPPSPRRAAPRSGSSRTPWSRRRRRGRARPGNSRRSTRSAGTPDPGAPSPTALHDSAGERGDVQFDLGGEAVDLELVERPLVPNPALLTTRSTGLSRSRRSGRRPRPDRRASQVGLEHLEAVVAVGDLAQAITSPGDQHRGHPGLAEQPRHLGADPRRRSGHQRRRERVGRIGLATLYIAGPIPDAVVRR
jgi:hypothetical protein